MSPDTPETGGRLAWWVATGFGVGRIAPVAPGSFGSLVGLGLGAAALSAGTAALVGTLALATAAGWWSAGAAARVEGRPDPPAVVIDEIAGQLVALLGSSGGAIDVALAFGLFRLFDIAKPWPVGRLEKLPGASGIMADDLAAGALAAVVAFALRHAFGGSW